MSAASRGQMSEKGARYLGLLDQALCNGNWSEIQELGRKTDKHAPERRCFTLTARSEAQIASASHRPTSAASSATSSIHGLGELLPQLAKAIEDEKRFPEDAYAAKVTTAEIHWLREDAEKAVTALGEERVESRDNASRSSALGWVEVCDVKSRLIRVAALESAGKEDEARQQYLAASVKTPGSRTTELRRWTERLLAKACMSTQRSLADPTTRTLSESLQIFQAWSDFWRRAPSVSSPPASSFSYLDVPRRQVWKAYYELLSTILQYGLMYNPRAATPSDLLIIPHDNIPDEQYTSAKQRQRAALKRVEATYESLLLAETQFPKASQTNTEVEEWTQQVISNWKIFYSSNWTDLELGDGGREAVGRGVLDILYRAATKTFHSTAILRQLFTVHASLGEFELAMHAFNSYVELVNKAKARAEKTGRHELGFDDDDSVVLTAAEAVRILCRYGDHEQGEKAMEVGRTIETWISFDKSNVDQEANGTKEDDDVGQDGRPNHPDHTELQSSTLAAAHRAIGIAHGQWARLTYETDSRSKLQDEAIQSLRIAQKHDEGSIETAYALALLLAETGDVGASTSVIKSAIAASNAGEEDEDEDEDEDAAIENFSRERQLVPLWHLLALCLSAKDDYDQAARMCGTAFEQFGDSTVLFGDENIRVSTDSEKPPSRSSRGVVDQMESLEKEGIVQVKMSQLALVELMEGAEAAVDVSHELLALYARIFGNLELMKPISKPPPTAASATPSRLGGTLRSLAGSIRPKSARSSVEKDANRKASVESRPSVRPSSVSPQEKGTPNGQNIGVPIAITVTNEDGVSTQKPHHHHLPFKLRGQHGDWREHGNLRASESTSSIPNRGSPNPKERGSPLPSSRQASHSNLPIETVDEKAEARDEPSIPEQPLKNMEHNAPHDAWPAPPGHQDQPPRQDVRLPAPHPASTAQPQPRLPSAQDRQQRISLLTKIWLFIAGLYLRADLFDDCGGAIEEAHKLVESFEGEVGAEHASARRFHEKGWASDKSVDQLWADVWAAKGDLSTARSQPFLAMTAYEQALSYYPDHPEGIIGLSNHLMDIYEEKIPPEEPRPLLQSAPSSSGTSSTIPPPPTLPNLPSKNPSTPKQPPEVPKPASSDPSPAELNRLAARDRAYMLLSTLTRLGSGWHNSDAWYTLARSHELSKQVGKAKQALWWVVELEENRPMRPWREVGVGGLSL